jgi:hypothetical protein
MWGLPRCLNACIDLRQARDLNIPKRSPRNNAAPLRSTPQPRIEVGGLPFVAAFVRGLGARRRRPSRRRAHRAVPFSTAVLTQIPIFPYPHMLIRSDDMTKKPQKVPVTLKAVTARINRKLAPSGEQLRAARGRMQAGGYYVVGPKGISRHNVDPERLARELDALKPWEILAR